MKYLHFITNDQFYSKEFIDIIHSKFKIDEHKFIIIKEKNKKHHINPEEYQNINVITISTEENILKFIVSHIKLFTVKYIKIRKLMEQSEYIFVHCLSVEISLILFRFRGEAKIIWIMWGYDLYQYLPLKLFDDYTLELLKKINSNVKTFIRKIYHSFNFLIWKRVIKRIDYLITPHKGDVRLLKTYFKTKAEWYPKGIYPNPVDFEKLGLESSNSINEKFNFKKSGGKLFLIGNSGSTSNNHLDIMIRLSKMKEQNFKIICPLSYGGSKNYIKKIIEKGEKLFGNRFVPLLDFYNPDQYFGILKQIDLAIMYHNRQQGGGSTHILVYLGKPICMKKTSGYFHLIENGVVVFPIQDLEKLILNEVEFTQAMSENNKKIATQELSTVKSAISSIERLLNLLDNRKDISGFGGNVDKKFKANY